MSTHPCLSPDHCYSRLGGFKHRQRDFALALILPTQPHPHSTLHVFDRVFHPNDVGQNPKAFIEIYIRHGIGAQFGKGGVPTLHDNRIGINHALAFGHLHGGFGGATTGAVPPRIEDDRPARIAGLIRQFMTLGRFPEGLRIGFWKTGLGSWSCHNSRLPP